MPYLDSLESFTPVIAPVPWIFSSVPSILTGLHPHQHSAIYTDDSSRNQDLQNPPRGGRENVFTLAELLAASGYETRFDTRLRLQHSPSLLVFVSEHAFFVHVTIT